MNGMIFLDSAIRRCKDQKALCDRSFAQLDEAAFHFIPSPGSNSIAVIIKHMNGNMLSRWTNFLTEDGEKQGRRRDEEFEEKPLSKEALLQLWEEGWAVFTGALEALEEADLSRTITIRSEPLPVIDAIMRQVSHYSHHCGQIVYGAKLVKGESWQSLSIPRGASTDYNRQMGYK